MIDPFTGEENCDSHVYRLMSCQKMCLQVGMITTVWATALEVTFPKKILNCVHTLMNQRIPFDPWNHNYVSKDSNIYDGPDVTLLYIVL